MRKHKALDLANRLNQATSTSKDPDWLHIAINPVPHRYDTWDVARYRRAEGAVICEWQFVQYLGEKKP